MIELNKLLSMLKYRGAGESFKSSLRVDFRNNTVTDNSRIRFDYSEENRRVREGRRTSYVF